VIPCANLGSKSGNRKEVIVEKEPPKQMFLLFGGVYNTTKLLKQSLKKRLNVD
jgi:hypothetical protein